MRSFIQTLCLLALVVMGLTDAQASSWDEDKAKHAKVSFAMGSVAQMYTEDWKVSMGACMAVGLAKEVYDEYSYGGFDGKDLLADAVGCSIGVIAGDTALKVWHEDDAVGIKYSWEF